MIYVQIAKSSYPDRSSQKRIRSRRYDGFRKLYKRIHKLVVVVASVSEAASPRLTTPAHARLSASSRRASPPLIELPLPSLRFLVRATPCRAFPSIVAPPLLSAHIPLRCSPPVVVLATSSRRPLTRLLSHRRASPSLVALPLPSSRFPSPRRVSPPLVAPPLVVPPLPSSRLRSLRRASPCRTSSLRAASPHPPPSLLPLISLPAFPHFPPCFPSFPPLPPLVSPLLPLISPPASPHSPPASSHSPPLLPLISLPDFSFPLLLPLVSPLASPRFLACFPSFPPCFPSFPPPARPFSLLLSPT
ncbi:unnamed protein product [Closterium sp. Naga37s-1]|nr:unnamed protein product [Closterium sp. Naga37s-1]